MNYFEKQKIEVGRFISNLRKEKGMTLQEFGKLFGATRGNVALWEKGSSLPSVERLKQISKVADISVNELLYERFITRVTKEEIDRVEQERISKGDRTLTPSIKNAWLEQVVSTTLNEHHTNPGESAESVINQIGVLNDLFDLVGISVEEVSTAIKANNESSLELLNEISTYPKINSNTIESIRKHYDRIDSLLPDLE